MKTLLLTFTILISAGTILTASAQAQNSCGTGIRTTPEDSAIYCRIMKATVPYAAELSSGELMVKTASMLYGTPYKSGTLETEPEVLTVNLRETDCILFVEACTAMTVLAKQYSSGNHANDTTGIPPFSSFCDMLQSLRYRNGQVNGYSSRLHYTSEWLLQAEENGILQEITLSTAGTEDAAVRLDQKFSFMSTHSNLYPALQNNPQQILDIKNAEIHLESAGPYFHIPAGNIESTEKHIKDGDIICFVSTTPGLDITHVGIACRANDGSLHFIHASMREGKVVFEKKTLAGYCRTGIRIARISCQDKTMP